MSRVLITLVFLITLTLPSVLFATESSMIWWRHGSTQDACINDAQAALAVAGMTDVRRPSNDPWVMGRAGEYVANVVCIDQTVTVIVAGPDSNVASSLVGRIRASW